MVCHDQTALDPRTAGPGERSRKVSYDLLVRPERAPEYLGTLHFGATDESAI